MPPVGAWTPYVSGKIMVTEIDATHYGMMEPIPLRQIARSIAGFLGNQQFALVAG
jgi:thioesterase domain-containing protein